MKIVICNLNENIKDDYNRYETQRARMIHRREEEERSRFSGYGDRPGSGVEFAPSKWRGGEVFYISLYFLIFLIFEYISFYNTIINDHLK